MATTFVTGNVVQSRQLSEYDKIFGLNDHDFPGEPS